MLVINAVYSQLRTRVLTAVFALLILRPSKIPLKTKSRAPFRRHRHHLTEKFSTPKAEFATEDGGNSRQRGRGLSVFADFSGFPRIIDAAPLSRSDLLPPDPARLSPLEGKKRKLGTGEVLLPEFTCLHKYQVQFTTSFVAAIRLAAYFDTSFTTNFCTARIKVSIIA